MGTSIALLLLKVSVLLAAALVTARVMARQSAVRRHALWSAAFIAIMLMPALGVVLPTVEIPMPARDESPIVVESAPAPARLDSLPVAAASEGSGILPGNTTEVRRTIELPSLRVSLLAAWATGALAAISALAVSLFRVGRLSRKGEEMEEETWVVAARDIAARLGFTRSIRLVTSASVTTPMAAGVVRPTVFLPADAALWPADRRDVVLAHEIAHLANRDPLRHLMGRLALTVYWFHPLAWLAARDATSACEQACDEAVLSLGVRPSAYAEVLLDFAAGAPPAMATAALPIVRRRLLETRLMAILDSSPRRATGRVIAPASLGLALTLCVAAVQPAVEAAPASVIPDAPSIATAPSLAAAPAETAPIASSPSPSPIVRETPAVRNVEWAADCGRGWDFGGSMTNSRGNGRVDRVLQKTFSDLRICAAAEDLERDETGPGEWLSARGRIVLETEERNGDRRRLETFRGVTTYTLNGRPAPFGPETEEWRRSVLAVVDAMSEISELRGRASTLRGEISTVRGHRSTLQGQISTLRGQVSTMRGEISTLRGQHSTMRGEISTIRGHQSTLLGQISSERGAISSLRASRNDRYSDRDAIDAAIRRHEEEIRRIEDEIRRYDVEARVQEVERRIAAFDVEERVREVEERLRNFDVEAKVAAVEAQIARLDVEGRVADIEGDITALDVDSRVTEMEARQEAALRRLRASLRR